MKRPTSLLLLSAISASVGLWTSEAAVGRAAVAGISDAPQDTAPIPLELEVNIPAFRLDVREYGRLTRSFQIAVGTRRHRTPTGQFAISRVTWNPWWYPPAATWAARDTITPPGPRNPMGKVKLPLGGDFYLHGTPLTASIGSSASHGCIRLQNRDAAAIARIVQQYGTPVLPDEAFDSLMKTWKITRAIDLGVAVPVSIVYRLAEVRDSMLTLYPDVYRVAGDSTFEHALDAVLRSGVEPSRVREEAVRDLVNRVRSKAITVDVKSILKSAAPSAVHARTMRP